MTKLILKKSKTKTKNQRRLCYKGMIGQIILDYLQKISQKFFKFSYECHEFRTIWILGPPYTEWITGNFFVDSISSQGHKAKAKWRCLEVVDTNSQNLWLNIEEGERWRYGRPQLEVERIEGDGETIWTPILKIRKLWELKKNKLKRKLKSKLGLFTTGY